MIYSVMGMAYSAYVAPEPRTYLHIILMRRVCEGLASLA